MSEQNRDQRSGNLRGDSMTSNDQSPGNQTVGNSGQQDWMREDISDQDYNGLTDDQKRQHRDQYPNSRRYQNSGSTGGSFPQ
jgi:hypothetical protein